MPNTKKRLIPFYQILATRLSRHSLSLSKEQKKAFVFLTPDYGNVGDLAIGIAQRKFLQANLPDYEVITIAVSDTYKYLRSIKKALNKRDLIFIVGGGNFGDLYPKADFGRIFLIKFFKYNPVCSLPQTMVFTDTRYGKQRLKATQKAFKANKRLTLFARETVSYKLMKNMFDNRVLLSPDIVFYLMKLVKQPATSSRKHITLTFRSDEEKLISLKEQAKIVKALSDEYGNLLIKDTVIKPQDFDVTNCEKYVNNMIKTYQQSKLVVTDRLHGMIFAAITDTPCIVLPNSNHKIIATYNNWLSRCNYITLVENLEAVEIRNIAKKYTSPAFKSNYSSISVDFNELSEYLKEVKDRR